MIENAFDAKQSRIWHQRCGKLRWWESRWNSTNDFVDTSFSGVEVKKCLFVELHVICKIIQRLPACVCENAVAVPFLFLVKLLSVMKGLRLDLLYIYIYIYVYVV